MEKIKPKLSLDEQIDHLKQKGILFNLMDENDAKKYLFQNNNYFKLCAYRKNYVKHPDGKNKGKYINLEFAYLVDIAVIDMRIRYRVVHMALDIEHHTKLELLRKMDEYDEDGYKIIHDYLFSLNEKQKSNYNNEINRNRTNTYCSDIIKKYDGSFSVWVFFEVITFGRLISFYGFCAIRFSDEDMKDNYYRLLTCKLIRNASAHSSCILNDLKAKTTKYCTNTDVTKKLSTIQNMSSQFRKNRMSNARVQQLITLFYMHKTMVKSEGINRYESEELKKIIERIHKNDDYYKMNSLIKGTFDFIEMVVDSWF